MNAMFWITAVVGSIAVGCAPPQWRWTVWAFTFFGFIIFRELEKLNDSRR